MPRRRDEGVLLVRYPFRERDLIVAALTRSSGLLRLLVRRARGPRSPWAGKLEPLALVRMTYFERPRSELATLDEVAMVRSAFALAQRPAAWAAGQVLSELALVFCPAGQRAEASFRLVDRCILALLEGHDPQIVVDYACVWTVRLAGVLPELDRCGVCGGSLGAGEAFYDARAQTFLCPTHAQGGNWPVLSAGARRWLERVLSTPVERVEEPAPADARAWVRQARLAFAERELVTLATFAALSAPPEKG
jgi:DNA repair protein RecO